MITKGTRGFWKVRLPLGFQVRFRFGKIENVTHRAFLLIIGRGLDNPATQPPTPNPPSKMREE